MTKELRVVFKQPLDGQQPLEYPLRIVEPVHPDKELAATGQIIQQTPDRGRDPAARPSR